MGSMLDSESEDLGSGFTPAIDSLGNLAARLFTPVDLFLHLLNEVVGWVINWFPTSGQG